LLPEEVQELDPYFAAAGIARLQIVLKPHYQ